MVNISLQFHESMVLAAEFFGSQYQNINCLPDNSLKLVIEILFFRSINGAVVLKKWHQTTVKIFVKKLLVAFNTNIQNLTLAQRFSLVIGQKKISFDPTRNFLFQKNLDESKFWQRNYGMDIIYYVPRDDCAKRKSCLIHRLKLLHVRAVIVHLSPPHMQYL